MNTANTSTDSVVIERVFNAPIELVWQMWTDPEHFARWYGPTGATIPVATIDATVGGTRLICMHVETPMGPRDMWFTGEHREVTPYMRLVYTESMCNADGNILAPADMGMPESHPTTTEVTVELTDVDGRTRMTMTHAGIPAGSPGEYGWNMALDKLAALLA